MKFSVFGFGYVGTVSAGCFAQKWTRRHRHRPGSTKADLINAAQSPIIEADIGEIVAVNVKAGRLRATCDPDRAIRDTDLSFVCVGTPSQANGNLDLRYIRRICEQIGEALRIKPARHTVVIRSTILPGTMREIVIPILEEFSGKRAGSDFGVCNNPEFLREGSAVQDFNCPPKTVIGEFDRASGDSLAALYAISTPADPNRSGNRRDGQSTSTIAGMRSRSASRTRSAIFANRSPSMRTRS